MEAFRKMHFVYVAVALGSSAVATLGLYFLMTRGFGLPEFGSLLFLSLSFALAATVLIASFLKESSSKAKQAGGSLRYLWPLCAAACFGVLAMWQLAIGSIYPGAGAAIGAAVFSRLSLRQLRADESSE